MQVGEGFSFAEIGFDKWKEQGRSEEAIAGVLNFLTGAGGSGILGLMRKHRDKTLDEVIALCDTIQFKNRLDCGACSETKRAIASFYEALKYKKVL